MSKIVRSILASVYYELVRGAAKNQKETGTFETFTSISALAKKLGCTVYSAKENIRGLKNTGFISSEKFAKCSPGGEDILRIIPLIDSSIKETPNEQ